MREDAAAGNPLQPGVGVDSVSIGGPADRAGIRRGDRILSVSGRPVEDLLDLHFLTSRSRFTLRWRSRSGAERERGFRLGGGAPGIFQIGRASCRGRGEISVGGASF